MPRPTLKRTSGAVVLALVLLAVGVGLGWVLRRRGLDAAADWAQLVSVPLAMVPVAMSLARWLRRPVVTTTSPDQLEQARRKLAELVLVQWRREIAVRQLDDPVPQAVRWRLTELDVMDHAKNVLRANSLSFFLMGWGKLRFSGRSDRAGELLAQFRRLERRRLVVLGEPGMGQTTLAVLLLRELLEHPEPGEPVPVMLTLSSWNPDREPFLTWLARRVGETYPALSADDFGAGAPAALVAGRHVLPVLDGLDELPESVRAKVIPALNAELTASDQLILTCRTEEYVEAVTAHEGDVLTGGAVIEPTPLNAADAAGYLKRCLPPRHSGRTPLIDQLEANPDGALACALATPLTLWLVRKVYVDGHVDPSELGDKARFPTAESITAHLLDRLVPTVAGAGKAERGLGFLADHLERTGSRDLAWWHLHEAMPRWFKYVLRSRPSQADPAYADLRLADRLRLLPRQLRYRWLALTAAPGLLVFLLGLGFELGVPGSALLGLVAGLPFVAVVFGEDLSAWLTSPATNDQARTPRNVLRGDATLTWVQAMLTGLVFALLGGLGVGIYAAVEPFHERYSSPALLIFFLLLFVFAIGMSVGFINGFERPSTVYFAVVAMLWLRRRTPLRLMKFLEDMHRLGILRQVGPVYQFRHAKLQDRLAETYRSTRMG